MPHTGGGTEIEMFLADKWKDYTLIDTAGGEKLEYWGRFLLRRPDPQAIWSKKSLPPHLISI